MDRTEFIRAGDQLIVDVHQVVRDQHGRVVRDHHVAHSYTFRGGLILRMREDEASWWIPPGTGCLPPARFVPAVAVRSSQVDTILAGRSMSHPAHPIGSRMWPSEASTVSPLTVSPATLASAHLGEQRGARSRNSETTSFTKGSSPQARGLSQLVEEILAIEELLERIRADRPAHHA